MLLKRRARGAASIELALILAPLLLLTLGVAILVYYFHLHALLFKAAHAAARTAETVDCLDPQDQRCSDSIAAVEHAAGKFSAMMGTHEVSISIIQPGDTDYPLVSSDVPEALRTSLPVNIRLGFQTSFGLLRNFLPGRVRADAFVYRQ